MIEEQAIGISRRRLLQAGSALAGYAVSVDKVLAQAIKTDTKGIVAGDQQVPIGSFKLPVYEARPEGGSGHPILIVISEIWGTHEYIRDATRRFAKEGFHAVAPELFEREGGVGHIKEIPEILKIISAQKREQTLGDIAAAADWANTRPGVAAQKVGVTGWCWGGSTTIQAAATIPAIKAAVAWYGPPARAYQTASGPVTGFDVAKDIKIPFLSLSGDQDKNPSPEDAKKFIEMLKHHNKDVDMVIYPGVGHGFHADYRPSYNAAAAEDGWKRCVAWLKKYSG